MAATQTTHTFLRDLWALARPYWFSEERRSARGLLAAVVALNLGIVYLDLGDKDKALASAKKAYNLGAQLPGLRERLRKAGVWKEAPSGGVAGGPKPSQGAERGVSAN